MKQSERKIEVYGMLNISRNTLDLWLKREEGTGDCRAITGFQQGNRHKITDWIGFREFAGNYGGKTQARLATLWGENVTQQDISRALGKIGFTRKKDLRLPGTRRA